MSVQGVLNSYYKSTITNIRNHNVGPLFYSINSEFYEHRDELHKIANAIRRNEEYFDSLFGEIEEDEKFPEGILLGHLHCKVERRDGIRVQIADRCEICDMNPRYIYASGIEILQTHLLVSPTSMDVRTHYTPDQFITVCPNCHAILHATRPWKHRGECREILL